MVGVLQTHADSARRHLFCPAVHKTEVALVDYLPAQ
jgi:hypothetical protein